MSKILLLGIGNESQGDDGVGIKIVRYFEKLDLQIFDTKYAKLGSHIFDFIKGYENVIIIEAFEKKNDKKDYFTVRLFNKDEIIDNSLIHRSHKKLFESEIQIYRESVKELVPKDMKFIAVEIPIQNSKYSNRLTKNTKKLAIKAIFMIYHILESFNITIYKKEEDFKILEEIIE